MPQEIYYDEDWNVIPMPLEERNKHLEAKEKEWKMFDAFGTELQPGDSIISIKPLPVKKWVAIKKWEKFDNIRFTEDPEHVSARHPKNGMMYLKTEFFKKV